MPFLTDIADDRRLPENATARRITPRLVIVHTMVGYLRGTDAFFRRSDVGVETHFGIGGPWDGTALDGAIWQWMDTDRAADGNRRANDFAISIETSDGGNHLRPWSDKQIDALVRLCKRLVKAHPAIPLRVCEDPYGSGFGWHAMWPLPGPWGPTNKSCPGSVRIAQLRNVVLPAVFAVSPIEEEDTMKEGDTGNEVVVMQWRINEYVWGKSNDPRGLVADGVYGPKTAEAVRSLQRDFGYAQTGDWNVSTRERVHERLEGGKRAALEDRVKTLEGSA